MVSCSSSSPLTPKQRWVFEDYDDINVFQNQVVRLGELVTDWVFLWKILIKIHIFQKQNQVVRLGELVADTPSTSTFWSRWNTFSITLTFGGQRQRQWLWSRWNTFWRVTFLGRWNGWLMVPWPGHYPACRFYCPSFDWCKWAQFWFTPSCLLVFKIKAIVD